MVFRNIALSLVSLAGTYAKNNKRLLVISVVMLMAAAIAVHFGLASFVPVLGAVTILDKFTGPKSGLPPAQPGTAWINKKGPFNEWNLMSLDEFNGMPVQDFGDWYGLGKRIGNAIGHNRWHERIWPAASTIAVSASGYRFFDKKAGDPDTYLDGTAAPVVDDQATNMSDGGRMAKSENLLVYALGIRVNVGHREFGGFTNNRPNTAAVSGTDTSSATAHLEILDRNAIFEFRKGSSNGGELVASGSLFDFPSKGGPGGVASGNTVEGFACNGNGFLSYLDEVVLLDEERQFSVLMKTYTACLSVLNVPIRPILYGALIKTL